MVIYKTINLINGKIYIGRDRYNNPSYLGSGKILKQSIKKYGIENFKKEIIEECCSLNELNEKEIYWIEKFNSRDRKIGYNITKGGNGGDTKTGNPNLEEIKRKMSKSFKGKKGIIFSEESKKKISEGNKGKIISEDIRLRTSNTLKLFYQSEDGKVIKNKNSKRMKNRKVSDETKEKMKLSKTGNKNPMKKEENKNKLRGIKRSEESKEKNRQKHLGKKTSEETKQKIRESMLKLKKKNSPLLDKKLSNNHKNNTDKLL